MSNSTTPPGMPVQIEDFRPLVKNTLRGFLRVRLGKTLFINDCTLMNSAGRWWVGLPSKPRIGRDGQPMLSDKGKPLYSPIVSWDGRPAADRFSEAVLAALAVAYPNAMDDQP